MPFDPNRLLTWRVPDKIQILSRRDVALYALSIGFGRDACDRSELRFVDPASPDFTAFPSMALVLGYPGFWLGDPALGIDALRVLHAEQSLEILRPIPVEGRITGRTRVTDLIDRGAEKGALLYSEREVFDSKGQIFARLRQTHILRGDGGFGGPSHKPPAPVSGLQGSPAGIVDLPIRPEQALLYRLNGDMNPIHSDPLAARQAGFPKPLLHGMCTFGMVAKAVAQQLCSDDPARLVAMSARFTGPVFPGETLRTEIYANGAFRARVLERDAVVVDFGASSTANATEQEKVTDHAV
ncbi:MaoC/PaaZ C-terminal domain-containing protein [Rhodoligotrophos defluvii]|uniref:MaoC/PaaZ C-terminal domain-containing protein n=1 Tax=Rhodoligotrophos defluvii TaxID=2561934 RepID=UPI0010C969FD|nr:MaoC/PaaZ C-terminal domain-containing protein [Rhodoligotrophos defluvii]